MSLFLVRYFFWLIFTLAAVFAQSSFNMAELPPVFCKDMVNCSVGEALVETFMSTLARSSFSWYSVPTGRFAC